MEEEYRLSEMVKSRRTIAYGFINDSKLYFFFFIEGIWKHGYSSEELYQQGLDGVYDDGIYDDKAVFETLKDAISKRCFMAYNTEIGKETVTTISSVIVDNFEP